jgi:hypothetical protein
VEDVIVAEDFTFAAAAAMADDVTGLGFSTRDAVDALTLSSFGLGDQSRFRFGFAFDRLSVQALLGPAFDHLCPRLLEWVHATLSRPLVCCTVWFASSDLGLGVLAPPKREVIPKNRLVFWGRLQKTLFLATSIIRRMMEGERDPVQLHDGAFLALIPATTWREIR